MDLTGGAHHGADRAERPGAGDPQLWRTSDVADVGLTPENEHVEIVRFHLGERPLAPSLAQCPIVGQYRQSP